MLSVSVCTNRPTIISDMLTHYLRIIHLFFFLIFFTLLPKLMMLAQNSIAAKEHVSIASATFILCMLQLIRIAHQQCTTQCSESPYATIIALMNTFVNNFLLQHVFCFLNIATSYTDIIILCDCKYTIYFVYVARNQNRTPKRFDTTQ